MKKLLFGLAALALFGAGCAAYQSPAAQAPASSNQPVSEVPTNAANQPKVAKIEMVPGGFSPSTLEVEAGTNVVFENKDTIPRWPASGVHPTHQLCPGFDALGSVAPGQFYARIFTEKKVCPFHDHLHPNLTGKLTIK